MTSPPVSIVVITRNEEKNIADCLGSLTSLDYHDYEIVVIDSSADRTSEIAKTFRKVKVYAVESSGFAHARNEGIRRSKNGLIAFTDADCIVPLDWLRKLVPHMKGATAAAGGAALPPKDSGYLGKCISCLGFPAGGALGADIMKDISTCNAIFSRKMLKDIGGFDEKLKHGTEDSDVSNRIKKSGRRIRIVPDSYVFHKTRGGWEFLGWCYRRGKAKYHKSRNPLILLSPLGVFVFPFTKKFRVLVRKREGIGIGLASVLLLVPFLFLLRQVMIVLGWLSGIGGSVKGKEKHKEVRRDAG